MAKVSAPRTIKSTEKPRPTRAPNLEKARETLYTRYPQLMKRAAQEQKTAETKNRKVDKEITTKLSAAEKKAKSAGKQLLQEERVAYEQLRIIRTVDVMRSVYYGELNSLVAGLGACTPDIDQISPFEVKPGYGIQLWGTCFGSSQGKVLFEIKKDRIVELEVDYWQPTHIGATLNRLYGGLSLRPYYGRIWIRTGAGATSNTWPMMFEPIRSLYWASWTKWISGGAFGDSGDGTLLSGVVLSDLDFSIEYAECNHWGEGHAELKSPYAGGQSYSQGWHYGIPWWDNGGFSIGYRVVGPKGITPPAVSGLGPWGYVGDID